MNDELLLGQLDKQYNYRDFAFTDKTLAILPVKSSETELSSLSIFDQIGKQRNLASANDFIGIKEIHGKVFDGRKVVFIVYDLENNISGVDSFEVRSYLILNFDLESDYFKLRLSIKSLELDCFFPSYSVFKYSLDKSNDGRRIPSIQIKDHKCEIVEGISTKSNCESWEFSTIYRLRSQNSTPLISNSVLNIDYQSKPKVPEILDSVYRVIKFLQFVSNRKDVSVKSISLEALDNDLKTMNTGTIEIFEFNKPDESLRAQRSVMKFDLFGGFEQLKNVVNYTCSDLFTDIYFFENFESSRRINLGRVMGLYIGFEREFTLIYGEIFQPSETYTQVKNTLIDFIDNQISDEKNKFKVRKKYKDFRSIVDGEKALVERVYFAYMDNREILDNFIKFIYPKSGLQEHKICEDIARYRNNVAHGNLGSMSLNDVRGIRLIELMIYAMRLKKCGFEKRNIQLILNGFFGYHIAHSK